MTDPISGGLGDGEAFGPPEPTRCAYVVSSANRLRCQRRAKEDSRYCWQHEQIRRSRRLLALNPEPLRVVPACRKCRQRAPWCSCGAMDYRPVGGGW